MLFGKDKDKQNKQVGADPAVKPEEVATTGDAVTADDGDAGGDAGASPIGAPPLKPFSKRGSHLPLPASPAKTAYRPEAPKRFMDIPTPGKTAPSRHGFGSTNPLERPRPAVDPMRLKSEDDRKLLVGRHIVLKGEIVACEHLVVEGEVTAELTDGKLLEVAEGGTYKGKVVVDQAIISGLFDGDLTAREKLIIQETGKVRGTIRYGRIIIESGGEISGDMQAVTPERPGNGH
ncbi:MAG: bactofilin family protein [Rhodospirillales bacterium]